MSRRLVPTFLFTAIIVISACGGDDTSAGFEADLGPIDPEMVTALSTGDDPDAVPGIQRNFLDGCVKGFAESIPELEPVQRAGLLQVCGCTYEGLVNYAYAEASSSDTENGDNVDAAAFTVFTDIEDDLRSGDGALPDDVKTIIRTCIRGEAGL